MSFKNALKAFATTLINNEHDDYDEYYQLNVSNAPFDDDSDGKFNILNRDYQKYKDNKALIIPWIGKSLNDIKDENEDSDEVVIKSDVSEYANGCGILSLLIKTDKMHLDNVEFCFMTSSLLSLSSFDDCIQFISLQRRKENKMIKYEYVIRLMYPPTNKQFVLFKYSIKEIEQNAEKTKYVKINYSIKRESKQAFDQKNMLSDFASFQTKMKQKVIDISNKSKNIAYDTKNLWIEGFSINLRSIFDSMANDIAIFIPVRSLTLQSVRLLTLGSSIKWGNIEQIKKDNVDYLKWTLKFTKGGAMYSCKVQLLLLSNNPKIVNKITAKTEETFTNYDDEKEESVVVDSKILCEWRKPYFAISDFDIKQYYVPSTQSIVWWIRRTTKKTIEAIENAVHSDMAKKSVNDDERIDVDMSFLNDLKTMKSSIITLDKREKFSKMKSLNDISWNNKEQNAIHFIKNEIFIDVEENQTGGAIRVNNNISGRNVFRFCIRSRDELIFIKNSHPSVFLCEYKLRRYKAKENNKSVYGYFYYIYAFAIPHDLFTLITYKRLQSKQDYASLITFKCNKYVTEQSDDAMDKSEWIESYRLIIKSNYPSNLSANDLSLTIPVFVNDTKQKDVTIKSVNPSFLGKGNLNYSDNCLCWKFSNFGGDTQVSRNVQFKLSKKDEVELEYNKAEDERPDVLVFGCAEIDNIEISNHTFSGIVVSGMKAMNDIDFKYEVWIRYCTKTS